MANKKLRGQREFHVIFKFDTDEQATDFIKKVKEWWYALKEVSKKIETALKDQTNEQKPDPVKKPASEKRKAGRPPKKDIQRQKR